MRSTVLAGHDLVLYVNGALFGLVTGMQWQVATDWRPEQVIDYGGPIEFMPGSLTVGGSFSIIRSRYNGSLEAQGITAFSRDLLKQKYLTFQVQDRSTGEVFYEATNVVVTAQTWSAGPKQLVQGQFTWRGMGWTNSNDTGGTPQ